MKFCKKLVISCLTVSTLTGCASSNVEDIFTSIPDKDYSLMYLRGVFNWWEVKESFKLIQSGADTYSVEVELIADGQPYDFKVADSQWTNELNCGTEFGEQRIQLDDEVTLYCAADSANLQFTPNETAVYRFIFDTSDNSEPELLIKKI